MNFRGFLRHPLLVGASLIAAFSLFLYAGTSVFLQARIIRAVGREVVPILQRLPDAERRRQALRAQLEAADIEQSVRGGSHDELVRSFVLPEKAEWDRTLATVELTADWMRYRGMLVSLAPVEMGPAADAGEGMTVQPLGLEAELTPDGARTWFSLLSLMGAVSIGDVLSPQRRSTLLEETERGSRAALTSVETFLAADLLRYAREPKPVEEQLRRSFGEEFMPAIDAVLEDPVLALSRDLLGGELGRELERQGLWPARFLSADAADVRTLPNGNVRIRLRLLAWGRGAR